MMRDILGRLFATELVLLVVAMVAASIADNWQDSVWCRRIMYALCAIIGSLVLTIIAYIWT